MATLASPLPARTTAKGLPMSYGMATTNVLPQPVQPRPVVAPNLPPSPGAPPFTYTPPSLGAPPIATPTAAFQAPTGPDPYQFRVDQANRGAQRSAFARGTGLSGGFQVALAKLNQNLASEETDKIYGRARDTYALNRDTNQQNYSQSLAGYQAGTGAQLDAGRLNLAGSTAAYDRTYGAQRDMFNDARDAAGQQTNVINANAGAEDVYAQQMAQYRAALEAQQADDARRQNEITSANQRRPIGPSLGGYRTGMPVLR